ncbi:MAG: SWIM zinc finger family protein [Prochlorotrichaceae cyanobacterium]|jgi:uncharacterized Zn finger protein
MARSQPISKTWWGRQFIEVVENSGQRERLNRGKAYLSNGRVQKLSIDSTGVVHAQVRGKADPYFGVTKEPIYRVSLELPVIGSDDWPQIVQTIAQKANLLAQLLMKELPGQIETCFEAGPHQLLPSRYQELHASCSCPDWGDPCKHIAGVIYLLAQRIDQDPFLLFEMRGLPRQDLIDQLSATTLGSALVAELNADTLKPLPLDSYYTRPQPQPLNPDLAWRSFWQGQAPPPEVSPPSSCGVSALAIKKQGDYPPFWSKNQSFLDVMEELYDRVKAKNKDIF